MKKLSIGTGLFVGLLLTTALTGILFLGRQLFGLPFVPFELFHPGIAWGSHYFWH